MASLLTTNSCAYSALGYESHFDVAADLVAGMSEQQCLATLTRGSRGLSTEERPLILAADREAILGARSLVALQQAEAHEHRLAVRVVVARRVWGFMGFGVFDLFLDERGDLVGFYVDHYN